MQNNTQIINPRDAEKTHTAELLNYFNSKNIHLTFIESSNNSVVSKLSFPTRRKRCSNMNNQYDCDQNKSLVVKEIKHKKEGEHCEQCNDLSNEVKWLKQVSHEYIIKLHDNQIYAFPNSCVILLPLARSDLFDYMTNYTGSDNFKSIKHCFRQVGLALDYLHNEKNLIHGDIKPENIFVFSKREYKLADFGFCKHQQNYTKRSDFMKDYSARSLKYLPPEFSDCIENLDYNMSLIDEFSSDLFGLGVALFQVVFKQCPFDQDEEFFCVIQSQQQQQQQQQNQQELIQQQSKQSEQNETQNMMLLNINDMKQQQVLDQMKVKKRQPKNKRKYYHREDSLYKYLYQPDKFNEFWSYFERDIKDLLKTTNLTLYDINLLKDLIQKLITPFSCLRLTISQFLKHQWFDTILQDS